MIILIYGDDEYRVNKAVSGVKKDFGQNNLNISYFENELNFPKIKADTETVPFLSDKKLVIVKNLSKVKGKKIQNDVLEWIKKQPDTCDVILLEETLTPKNWLLAGARGHAQIQNLSKMRPYEVSHWIKELVTSKGGQIDTIAAEKLAALIGNDLWRLDNEIQKLLTYNKHVTLETVNRLVEGEFLDNIFVLTDALSEKKIEKALPTLNGFLGSEDSEMYLLSMLSRQIRNLISIKDLDSKGLREADIATKLKLHPYVVKNTLRQSKNFTFEQLLSLHQSLLKIDYNLKTTNIDSKAALTRLVYKACRN
jgi:DNA polymerase-3 subunit delta